MTVTTTKLLIFIIFWSTRYYLRVFTYIVSLNSHNSPVRQYYYFSHFADKKTKAQRHKLLGQNYIASKYILGSGLRLFPTHQNCLIFTKYITGNKNRFIFTYPSALLIFNTTYFIDKEIEAQGV